MRAILLFAFLFTSATAFARPVSYPEGWTVVFDHDVDVNSSLVHYSPTAKYSVGWRHDYFRADGVNADTAQVNYLVKRWNAAGSQANIYLQSGAGIVYDSEDTDAAAFTGVQADWENRRYFTSYQNRFFYGGDLTRSAKHEARVGVAPYIGDYGDVHTWLMLQADYDAGQADDFSLTPLVRMFKGTDLVEAGYNLDGGLLFNYIHRF